MHYIQKHILDELRKSKSARYTQLISDNIESGHFRYHLTQLIKDGYVAQQQRGVYALTPKGLNFIDKLSEHKVTITPMPKVITYTLLKSGNAVLLQKKQKQPYLGLLNMIGGKLHQGELAQDAAKREVYEKTGIKISDPELRGVFEILIHDSGTLLTHAIAYVFIADTDVKMADPQHVTAIKISELKQRTDLAPDFMPILTSIIDDADSAVIDRFDITI